MTRILLTYCYILFCLSVVFSAPRPNPKPEPTITAESITGDWTFTVGSCIYHGSLLEKGRWYCWTGTEHYEGKWSVKDSIVLKGSKAGTPAEVTLCISERVVGTHRPLWIWKQEKIRIVRGGRRYNISGLDGDTFLMRRKSELLRRGGKHVAH